MADSIFTILGTRKVQGTELLDLRCPACGAENHVLRDRDPWEASCASCGEHGPIEPLDAFEGRQGKE